MKETFLIFLTAVGILACGNRRPADKALDQLAASADHPVMALQPPLSDSDSVRISDVVVLDHTVHDFGTIGIKDGPQSCQFKLTNISDKDIVIYEVVASCGCTDVQWTRKSIAPGASGTITATYKNSDGPYPFDKMLTCYIAGIERPVILRLRGVVRKK